MTQVTGIDVSHFQGTVNWGQVAAVGNAFGFAKATQGLTVTDPAFAANWAGIAGAGLVRGAYHFFQPGDDGTAQAEHFLSVARPGPGDLPPVLDVESSTGVTSTELWQEVTAWLGQVESAVGAKPILYVAPGFWHANSGPAALTGYPLWLADYASQPTLPYGFKAWTFWQHSQTGTVAGVSGAVDLDLFAGTLDQLHALQL
jgi:lysozyme